MTQKYVGKQYKDTYKPKSKNRYRIKADKLNIIALAFSAFIVLLLCIAVINWRSGVMKTLSYDSFYDGVVVDGVNLSGMTHDQAQSEVAKVVKNKIKDVFIKITYDPKDNNGPGEVKTWEYDYITLITGGKAESFDKMLEEFIAPKLAEAYAQGRTGSNSKRLDTIKKIKKTGWSSGISINYDVLNAFKPELDKIKAEIEIKPVDAKPKYDAIKNEFKYVKEKSGWMLDSDELFNEIETKFNQNHSIEIALNLKEVEPKYTEEMLSKGQSLISKFSTDYELSSPNRKNNVQKAIMAFNGKIIWPGETISFNKTTGERTKENGYLPASIIQEDKSVQDGYGGGVCQPSTTFYVAARLAQLDIVTRYHHSFPSHYVDKGFDATVDWPTLDLEIKNNRELPIYIRTYYNNKNIYIELYSIKHKNDGKVSLLSEILETVDAPEYEIIKDTRGEYVKYTNQSHITVNSQPGYKVKVSEVIKDDTGKEISRKALYTDTYYKVKGKKYVGVTPPPTKSPKPSPTPKPTLSPTNTEVITD